MVRSSIAACSRAIRPSISRFNTPSIDLAPFLLTEAPFPQRLPLCANAPAEDAKSANPPGLRARFASYPSSLLCVQPRIHESIHASAPGPASFPRRMRIRSSIKLIIPRTQNQRQRADGVNKEGGLPEHSSGKPPRQAFPIIQKDYAPSHTRSGSRDHDPGRR